MIKLSGITTKTLLGKLLYQPLRLIPRSMVLQIKQGPCSGMKWIAGSSLHGWWLGTYEADKLEVFAKFIKPGMVVYDLGANAGIYSLLASKLVGSEGKVFAFEPLAENADNILKHIKLNQIENVTLVQGAVADKSGLASFAVATENLMGAITREDTQLKVPVVSVDDLVESFDFPLPDLMKIDVEGAEGAVLKGLSMVMTKKKPIIFVALHSDEQKSNCQKILMDNDYQLFWLNGDKVEGELEDSQNDEIYAVPT